MFCFLSPSTRILPFRQEFFHDLLTSLVFASLLPSECWINNTLCRWCHFCHGQVYNKSSNGGVTLFMDLSILWRLWVHLTGEALEFTHWFYCRKHFFKFSSFSTHFLNNKFYQGNPQIFLLSWKNVCEKL